MSALPNICRITAFNLKIFIKQGEGAQLHGCHTASRQCAEKKSHLNCVSSAILLADCVRQKDGMIMLEHHLEHFTWFSDFSLPPRCRLNNSPETYLSAGLLLTVPYQTRIVSSSFISFLSRETIQRPSLFANWWRSEPGAFILCLWGVEPRSPSLPVVN